MSKYETHLWKEPELPFVLNRMLLDTQHKLSGANWHENVELLYVINGSGYVLNGGHRINLAPGDITVFNSNVIHDVGTDAFFEYYYLIIDRPFCVSNYFDTNQIHYTQEKICDRVIADRMQEIIAEYEKAPGTPFRTQSIRAQILSVMVYLGRNYTVSVRSQKDSCIQEGIKQAIDLIRLNLSSPDLSLEAIAESVGISKYYFAHKFRQITGYTCVNYINLMRCEKAKMLLSEKQTEIKEIGVRCGFNSHSYFTRVFRECTGQSPTDYRTLAEHLPAPLSPDIRWNGNRPPVPVAKEGDASPG